MGAGWIMGRRFFRLLTLASLTLTGCASQPDARYVYRDGKFGVIGIPRNSSLGKRDYRSQAHELMSRHFPEGYEIVRAEEVVEGERTLDRAIKKELETDPGFSAMNQMLKIGKFARSSSLDQKDTTHITESRIIYKRKDDANPPGHDGFAAVASLSPQFYLDPNEAVRKLGVETMFLAKKEAKGEDKEKKLSEAQVKDDSVAKAGAAGRRIEQPAASIGP